MRNAVVACPQCGSAWENVHNVKIAKCGECPASYRANKKENIKYYVGVHATNNLSR